MSNDFIDQMLVICRWCDGTTSADLDYCTVCGRKLRYDVKHTRGLKGQQDMVDYFNMGYGRRIFGAES